MTGSLFDVQREAARFSFNTVFVLFVFQQGASNAEKFDYVSVTVLLCLFRRILDCSFMCDA